VRSKKIPLGFQVVNTRTGEPLSEIFSRREPCREIAKALGDRGVPSGVQKIEAYVHEGWKRGDDLSYYVSPELLERIGRAKR